MAEIGLIASVVGVAGAALTSSRALFEMVDEVRNAPVEISAISKDIHSFHDVVSSVQMAIRDRLVIKALLGDTKLCELVVRLEAPLQNCSNTLNQLKPRIQTHLKSTSDGKFRISSINVRWIYKKKDIIDCRNRLEVTKSTLDAALSSVIFFCSLRSASQDIDRVLSSDAGSVLREYAESIAPRSPPLDASSSINRIELPVGLNGNPDEFDAEAVGNPSSDLDSTEHRSPSETFNSNQAVTKTFNEFVNPNETSENLIPNSTAYKSTVLAKTFFEVIKSGDLNLINALLQEGYDVNHATEDGETALHVATFWGREEIVRILLANNANVNTKNLNSSLGNMAPLQYAASCGHKRIVEALLDNGADIAARDLDGSTAMGLSIWLGHDDTAIALILRASTLIDMVFINDLPLRYAIRHRRPKVVEALIARGKQLGQLQAMLDARDKGEWTHLALASWSGSVEIGSQLLAVGADIEEPNPNGWTPLIAAASMGRFEMVDFLIAQGADRLARNYGEDYLQILERKYPMKYEEYMRKVKS